MKIRTHVERSMGTEDLPGVIGRVWKVDGVTQFDTETHVESAQVKVNVTPETDWTISQFAIVHELGHVGCVQDVVDEVGHTEDLLEIMRATDTWSNEIEAWVRGFEMDRLDTGFHELHNFQFVLDCLNTYRRSRGKSDEDWKEAVEVVALYYEGDPDDLRNYEPNEPDPSDPPPQCGILIAIEIPQEETPEETPGDEDDQDDQDQTTPEPKDEDEESQPEDTEDEDKKSEPEKDEPDPDEKDKKSKPEPEKDEDDESFDDEGDGDSGSEDGDDQDDDPESGEDDPGSRESGNNEQAPDPPKIRNDDGPMREAEFQLDWLDQQIIEEINDGMSLQEIAEKHGLDLAQAPPLILAMGG